MEYNSVVAIVTIDDDGDQFRYTLEKELLEVPIGGIDLCGDTAHTATCVL